MVDKVVRDGKVAVIVSPGFGAGWSTWASEDDAFDPAVVAWIEAGKPKESQPYPRNTKPDGQYIYTGGLQTAEIEWLEQGTQFRINEYDGQESLEIIGSGSWQVA